MLKLTTIRFLLAALNNKIAPVNIKEHQLAKADGSTLLVDVYNPINKTPKGTMLFTHGLSRVAHRDERLVTTVKGLVTAGFRVVVPLYPKLQQLLFDETIVDDIADSIQTIMQAELCSHDKLAIFGVSFTATPALAAASRPDIAPYISSFLALGCLYDYEYGYQEFFKPEGAKSLYARLIAMRYIFRRANVNYSDAVDQVFLSLIEASHNDDEVHHRLEEYTQALTDDEKAFMDKYVRQAFSSSQIYNEFIDTIHESAEKLYRKVYFDTPTFPTVIIHSETDDVVHYRHSELLYDEIKKKNPDVRLDITSLLDHVNHSISIFKLKEIIRFIGSFNYFFKHV